MSTNTNLKAYLKYDKQGYLVPGSLTINRSKPAVGDWEEIPYSECCPTGPIVETFVLTLIYDDVANAPVADPSNADDWNALMSTSKVLGAIVTSTGEIKLRVQAGLIISGFASDTHILRVIDEGCVSSVNSYGFNDATNLEYIDFPNATDGSLMSFNNCVSLSYVNLPKLYSVSESMFEDCISLTVMNIAETSSIIDVQRFGFQGAKIPSNFPFSKLNNVYNSAFRSATGFTDLLLPKVANIEDYAFAQSSITSFTIPVENTVINISGVGVFQNCTSLESYIIEAPGTNSVSYSVFSIQGYMFDGCINLSTFSVVSPITYVYGYAFRNCTQLTSIYFPSANVIGTNTFENCTNVTSIFLPNSYAIGDNFDLNNVFLGITGKTISAIFSSSALTGNTGSTPDGDIAYLLANNTVTYANNQFVGIYFDNISSISSLVPTYTNIASWNTFFDLPTNGTAFTSVIVANPGSFYPNEMPVVCLYGGASITIKTSLFENVVGIRKFDDSYGKIVSVNDNGFRNSGLILPILPLTTTFGNRVFQGCSYFSFAKFRTYPSFGSATSFGDYCFEGVGTLSVSDPNYDNFYASNITTIGQYCFANSRFTDLNLPNLTAVSQYAFQNCTRATAIQVQSANSVGDGAFAGCTSINSINIRWSDSLGSTTGNNGVFAGITGRTIALYIQEELYTVNGGLPDGDLVYLYANNTVNPIYTTFYPQGLWMEFNTKANALSFFGGTIDVSSVNTKFNTVGTAVPFDLVTVFKVGKLVVARNGGGISIPNSLFSGNVNIVRVDDGPDYSFAKFSIVNIGDDAFNGCTSLTSARFQIAVNYGARAFKDCTALSSVNLQHAHTFGNNCFENCTSLTSFNYVRDLVSVGNYAFAGCTDVTSYDFPALATIGDYAFYNNTSVTSINIPYCTNLGTTTGNDNVFTGISGNTITLTIPTALDTDADVIALQGANTVTLDRPSFQLIFPTKADVDAITSGDCTNVANWNTFFGLPTNGTPFASVIVTENAPIIRPEYVGSFPQQYGCEIKLYGGGNMTISGSRFQNYRRLRKIIDNGNTVVRVNQFAFYQAPLAWYNNTGSNGLTPIEISLPACTFMERYAFYSSFGGYFVNLPRMQYFSSFWILGGVMNLSFYYGPVLDNYEGVKKTLSFPNAISMGASAMFANNGCISVNLPQQTYIPTYTFATDSGHCNIPAATATGDQIWWGTSTMIANMPLVTALGSNPADNNQWGPGQNPFDGSYRINPVLMTNNAGGPDGDVVKMINGGANIYLT